MTAINASTRYDFISAMCEPAGGAGLQHMAQQINQRANKTTPQQCNMDHTTLYTPAHQQHTYQHTHQHTQQRKQQHTQQRKQQHTQQRKTAHLLVGLVCSTWLSRSAHAGVIATASSGSKQNWLAAVRVNSASICCCSGSVLSSGRRKGCRPNSRMNSTMPAAQTSTAAPS
jgi:cation transport ATPase